MFLHLQSGLGVIAILMVAWIFSENRRAFPWRTVAGGLFLQSTLALLLLNVSAARDALFALNGVVDALSTATSAGTSLVFGYIGGGPAPFAVTNPAGLTSFAFGVLPLVLVIAALSALLWHWRILPVVVGGIAYVLRKVMGLGGAVGLGSGATIFLGMVEAPLLIKPYLAKLSRAELFILMTVGLASVAGTVFVLYATILRSTVEGALGHILIASMMSLPAGVLIARIMIPGDAVTDTVSGAGAQYRSSMDAIVRGTEDGLKMFLQIMAMLIVFVALVALANIILASVPEIGAAPVTLQRLFGWAFAPVVWLYGVPWDQAVTAGSLMGTKTVLNELIAYLNMAALPDQALDPRSKLIMLYALCGFANPGSVGILIAGLSSLIPERRDEVVPLAMRALFSGTLAGGLTGALIGFLPVTI